MSLIDWSSQMIRGAEVTIGVLPLGPNPFRPMSLGPLAFRPLPLDHGLNLSHTHYVQPHLVIFHLVPLLFSPSDEGPAARRAIPF